MKSIFTVLIFCYLMNIFAQTNNEIEYDGGDMVQIILDTTTNEVLSERPFARVMSVSYDTYFKNYWILFEVPEGATGINLIYAKNLDNGMVLMYDRTKPEQFYYVSDELDSSGLMLLISRDKHKDTAIMYRLSNVKRVKN